MIEKMQPVADSRAGAAEVTDWEARMERNRDAIAQMEQWLAEPPNEEDERCPELQAALEANRAGQRKLFGG